MADADPNIPNAALEGRYLPAGAIAASAAALPRVNPPTPPYGDDRLIWVRRSVLGEIIELALQALDLSDGNSDVELNGDEEDDIHENTDQAWVEWTTMRRKHRRSHNLILGPEDAEEDDGGGDDVNEDTPGFDAASRVTANLLGGEGPGCSIADPDYGGEEAGERDDGE